MDGVDFDRVTRTFAANSSRRRAIQATAIGLLAGLASRLDIAAGKPNKKKKKGNGKPKKKKPCPRARRCGKACCKSFQTCRKGRCIHHCNDGKTNLGETGIDCGGTCRNRRKCPATAPCVIDADCQSGICHLAFGSSGFCVDCLADSDCAGLPGKKICNNFLCEECASDADCTGDPGRPYCIATNICRDGAPCECSECRPGQGDCPDDAPFCVPELGICSEDECRTNADCASGCCDQGECADLSSDPGNCGRCGNQCPGAFPQCVMCCAGVCKNPPRDPFPEGCECP